MDLRQQNAINYKEHVGKWGKFNDHVYYFYLF